MAQMKTRRNGK